ncbi:MAG TPA: DUF5995 family protein [Bryobacteraceae bacterium]|nr:DUF5995 family protein [Bryobacteraceae bacterium]
MFPYDAALVALAREPKRSIADVLQTMKRIDAACIDGDGLKWFNWLYLQVTSAVEACVAAGTFADPGWLSELDIQFGQLYFGALGAALTGAPCPGCWKALFDSRDNVRIARIQFALAGINAHINHDLAAAIVATCRVTNTVPHRGTAQYNDYTGLNATLDAIIEPAKHTLNVCLLGAPLPCVSHLSDLIAAWGTSEAREGAWKNAEVLWHLQGVPALASGFMDSLDGLATFAGSALLVPVP